jgi:hypothetical protein
MFGQLDWIGSMYWIERHGAIVVVVAGVVVAVGVVVDVVNDVVATDL